MHWIHAGPTILAAFLASLVEFVEALTVVLAVGTVRGWRPAIGGAAVALGVLLALVLVFGRSLALIPLPAVQLVIGTLLLMFGLRWLRKAVLRAAGIIPMHDEAAVFAAEVEALRRGSSMRAAWDRPAFLTAFKIVMLEGIEVVFIVIAIGAGGHLAAASAGAGAALAIVILLGAWLHRPLARVPENALKFGVGVLLSGFGTFWVGEGVRLRWPGGDWAILLLLLGYLVLALGLVSLCRVRAAGNPMPRRAAPDAPKGWLAEAWQELVGLFVDDGSLAVGVLIWVAVAWAGAREVTFAMSVAASLFFAGFALLLCASATRAAALAAKA
ncbi:MAG: COG4280 domain-containing protein [Burkholderiaceae bacterium]